MTKLSVHTMRFPKCRSLTRGLTSLLTVLLLMIAQHAWANIKIANQILGKSTLEDSAKLPPKSFSVEKAAVDYSGGETLWVEGPIVDNMKGSAILLYDVKKRLTAVFIWAGNSPTEMLKRLAKSSRAKPLKDKSFNVGDWHVRIEGGDKEKFIAISTPSFDAQLQRDAQKRKDERNLKQRLTLIASIAAGTIAAFFIYLILRMKKRNKGWAPRNTTMYLEKKRPNSMKSTQPTRLLPASSGAAILATATGISYRNAPEEISADYTPSIQQSTIKAYDHAIHESASDTSSSFDSYDYCEPAVNCANGMPMHNGVDIYGNFYGSNFNDPW